MEGEQHRKKSSVKGYNSFIAHKPFDEFQFDLFFMTEPDQTYNIGMLIVDSLTKYTEVTPLKTKTEGSLLAGLMEGFAKMGGKSITVYSDDEPALSSKYTDQFFDENHIIFLATRTHAGINGLKDRL